MRFRLIRGNPNQVITKVNEKRRTRQRVEEEDYYEKLSKRRIMAPPYPFHNKFPYEESDVESDIDDVLDGIAQMFLSYEEQHDRINNKRVHNIENNNQDKRRRVIIEGEIDDDMEEQDFFRHMDLDEITTLEEYERDIQRRDTTMEEIEDYGRSVDRCPPEGSGVLIVQTRFFIRESITYIASVL